MFAIVASFFAVIPVASARDLTASLANTKWSFVITDRDKTKAWVILRSDGTLKKGWGGGTVLWKALDSSRIEITWNVRGLIYILRFNEALTEAVDEKNTTF